LSAAAEYFDLKSTAWTLTSLQLRSPDLDALAQALQQRFGDTPELFDGDPLAIDLSALQAADVDIDFPTLTALLRRHRLWPIAVQSASPAQLAAARAAGLVEAPEAPPPAPPRAARSPQPAEPEDAPAPVAVPATAVPTLVVDRPLRSGQQVYARGGDLVVLAPVSHGAEVIADGHIHVYAPLRGKAIAGARGNGDARIFALAMDPELLSIAGIYRTSETALPDTVRGKAAQVRLLPGPDGDKLVIDPLNS
jgi:septum site-determining protein MinC